ncbi:MAG: ComF family protein [Lachnospiraceae bacterium]|nr:ComF family protein [Lachnospiraceae bacterium]
MKERKKDIQGLKEGYRRSGICDGILDFLFPRRCPFCDEVVKYGDMICDRCRDKKRYIEGAYCMKCGKPLLRSDSEYCKDCKRTGHNFLRGRALYIYSDEVRASITRFKYHGRREYAGYYGREMAERLGSFIKGCGVDCLVPVPVSMEKLKKRGYNQAELISERISAYTGIPTEKDLILRIRDTPPMKELTRAERMKNLKGAFKINSHVVKCRNVMIVDDIYTTGSTIDAVAAALLRAGVKNVYFITLAAGAPV